MSETDDSKPGDDGGNDAQEGYEDTVVEILSLGDEADAPDAGDGSGAQSPGTRHLESQLAVERERLLRLRADFDNFRKRTERDRAEIERFALADALRDLLPVADNLERALAVQVALGTAGEGGDLRKGVEMIVRQMQDVLKRHGLVPIPALGERFDPSIHEAVLQEETEGVTAPTVAVELQRGYRLNDRLLRPSLVKVAVPRETTNGDSSSDLSQ